jgi:uncharacterized protein (DUF1330 family)
MKTRTTIALSILAGAALGAAAVQALHAQANAQAKPPAYVIAELDIKDAARFDKEYVPPAAKAVIDGGGKYLVRGGTIVPMFGEAPKGRVLVMMSPGMDQAKAAFDSPAFKAAKQIGDKYASFRVYAVEGLGQ